MDWSKSQLDAIEHRGSDLIISAAAGSGKSTTLAERILRRLRDEKKDISRMLIVTFTIAAAAELKNKISKLIADALSENPENVHLSQQLIHASYAEICTIDSFSLKVVKSNIDKLPINGDIRIGEEAELEILSNEVMEDLISDLYESKVKSDDFLLVADCYSSIWSESGLSSAILKLYKNLKESPDGIKSLIKLSSSGVDFLQTPFGKVLLDYILDALNYFRPIYNHALSLFYLNDKARDAYAELFENELDYLDKLYYAITRGITYDELRNIALSYKFPSISGKRIDDDRINLGYFKAVRAMCASFFQRDKEKSVQVLLTPESHMINSSIQQNEKICTAIYNILCLYEKNLWEKKRLLSLYSFDDISSLACDLLIEEDGSPSDIARNIAECYDEIYIDEYQDTNSVQDKIFASILRSKPDSDENSYRFMVGDIKQSIYRFRSAEPEIFSHYRTTFTPIDKYTKGCAGAAVFMSENFRCDEKIIDFSNLVSDYMFKNSFAIPYGDEDRLKYAKDIKPELKKKKKYRDKITEVHLIDTSKEELKGLNVIEHQADYVARRIRRLIDFERLPNGNRIRPSDITILFRTNTPIPTFISALEKYGVSSRYQVAERFFDKPHVMLMMCILNAIDNPSRDIYLAGALHSNIFDISLEKLIKIKGSKQDASLFTILNEYVEDENADEDLKNEVSSFIEKIKEYRKAIRKMSAHEAIAYVFGKTNILNRCTSEEKADLIKLYNKAREYEGDSFKGLFSFLKFVEKLNSGKGEKEFKGNANADSVKLMTIHASKGLEFNICFICNLEHGFSYQDSADPILFHKKLGIAGYVGKEGGLVRFEPLIRKCVSRQFSRDMHEEEMRILYVAMTRAAQKLILVGSIGHPEEHLAFAKANKDFVGPYNLYSASSPLSFIIGAIANEDKSYRLIDTIKHDAFNPSLSSKGDTASREIIDKYKAELERRFSFEYKYEHLKSLPSKISISKLHPRVLDGTDNDDIKIEPLDSMPEFMLDAEKKVSPAQRGTATHVFMQFCDFERLVTDGVKCELERLVAESYISSTDAEIIKSYHLDKYLEKFAKSQLLADILKAKNVIREFRFNVMLDASDFTEGTELAGERVLVQGVTDCIYETKEGELVLVDYKTDYVTPDNYEEVLLNSHRNQLTYYKKACEMMFERPISRVLIYSVPLAKTVEVK